MMSIQLLRTIPAFRLVSPSPCRGSLWSFFCSLTCMPFSKKARHLKTGERGERAAALYLQFKGYHILERNYLCPLGEIDIVASKKGVTVFIEVRTRRPGALVDPLESINDLKLAHMMDAARHFMVSRGRSGSSARFDIVTVRPGGPVRCRIRHYQDAFRTTDERPTRGRRIKTWLRCRPRPGGRSVTD